MTNENRTSTSEWLEQYAKEPIKRPTKEEAIANLQRLGVLDSKGDVKSEYIEVVRYVTKGELND